MSSFSCAPLRTLDLVRPIIRHHHELLDGSGWAFEILRADACAGRRDAELVAEFKMEMDGRRHDQKAAS